LRRDTIKRQRRVQRFTVLGAIALSPAKVAWFVVLGGCAAATEHAPTVADQPLNQVSSPDRTPDPAGSSTITEEIYGEHNGDVVKLYTLTNENRLVLKVINYGAIITEFHVPDAKGELADIVLGYDSLGDYVKETPYFGATIGRVANRIKNAAFELAGKKYKLAANDGPNFLHGGNTGWDKVVWEAHGKATSQGPQIIFAYTSPDGEEGFPGTVQATTTYSLTNQNELVVEMRATTDKTTLVNMAHHSYWNLGGHSSGTIKDHVLILLADTYTPAIGLVPDGSVKPVEKTPFDFAEPKLVGRDLEAAGGDPVGFDHNWIINGDPHQMRPIARLKHPPSGRVMSLSANQPALQFYSGNFLDGSLIGKGGTTYVQYSGLCLESQKIPNSINVPQWRDEVILKPGEEYVHRMVHTFTTE